MNALKGLGWQCPPSRCKITDTEPWRSWRRQMLQRGEAPQRTGSSWRFLISNLLAGMLSLV
ncbi:hypothetical protein [Scytonema sp. NUACC21]